MDPISNPYSPGAGAQPPELAGRDDLLQAVHVAIERIRRGRTAKSALMVGLRGVGKTVLLRRMHQQAAGAGNHCIWIEAPEGRSLPAILAPQLRHALLRLSTVERARDLAQRGLRALSGFVGKLRVKYQDIEVGLDHDPEPGLADNGDLETDLPALLEAAGLAAMAADTALVIFVDELQYVEEDQLASLISALHHCTQRSVPVILVGAGLPQLRGQMGNAKSYAERLFDFPFVGPLDRSAAVEALQVPARELGVEYTPEATDRILEQTQGYPYFIQEWGKHCWDVAEASPIDATDVARASEVATAAMDASFFRVRFDRLTPSERRYLRAMAELGPGPHRSGDVAAVLGRRVTSLGPTRNSLIRKGMVWSPSHGDTAFTVPMFDAFMKRIMPSSDWLTA